MGGYGILLRYALPVIVIAIMLALAFVKAFLIQINLINSVLLGSLSGSLLYCCNRYNDLLHIKLPFNTIIHPAICFVIGIVVCVFSLLVQRTKIGFWIFAIIFSIGWAALLSAIVYFFIKDIVWFWTIFGIAVVINFTSHLRSRNLKIDIAKTLLE